MIIILLMMFNTYVFQVGLVSLLLERFRALLLSSALYLTLSICFHCWVLVCSPALTYNEKCILFLAACSLKFAKCFFFFNYFCRRTSDGLGQIGLFGQMVFSLCSSSREQVLSFTSSKISDIHTSSALTSCVF